MSYRRSDVPEVAEEVRLALRDKLYRDVFLDRRVLEGGESWPKAIRRELARADVVFVVIGPGWQAQRLDDEDDYVRAELVAARRNRAVITPLLVDVDGLPQPEELPAALRFLPEQQVAATLTSGADRDTLWDQTVLAAAAPTRRARRRKWSARGTVFGVALLATGVVWFVQRSPETCSTDALDIGVAARLEDRRPAERASGTSAEGIADELADTLGADLQSSPGIEVVGPAACGPLGDVGDLASPRLVAAGTGTDVLVAADVQADDQESQVGLSLTFDADAVPDAPEVEGTHGITAVTGGRDVSPGVVAQLMDDELGQIAGVLEATQLYAAGEYQAAFDRLSELSAELSGADASLRRVIELLRANSLLVQGRAIRATDPTGAERLYARALEIYEGASDLGGEAYGRAYLGIGAVATERCRSMLATSGSSAPPPDLGGLVDGGLAAFETARSAAADAAPAAGGDAVAGSDIEVGLKASLGRGNLALCGMLASQDPSTRRRLVDEAEEAFTAVTGDTSSAAGFANLASEANVGLAVADVARCEAGAPEAALERASSHLRAARQGARPSQEDDIDAAISVVQGAIDDGAVDTSATGELSSSLSALVAAACALPGA